MDVTPDEIVKLNGRGDMTARSAVRIVMQDWSAKQRDGARRIVEGVIFREGEPPILGIAEIEVLWLRPAFHSD
jgi:hypothetical protein